MKFYRYMSLEEFVKMSKGNNMQANYHQQFTHNNTDSKGFCFLGSTTVGKSTNNEEIYEFSPEECLQFLSMVTDEILVEFVNANILRKKKVKLNEIDNKDIEEITIIVYELLNDEYESKIKELPWEIVNEFEKAIALRVIDLNWMNHINNMEHLKEGTG